MAVTTAAVIGAASTAKGLYDSSKAAKDAKNVANSAINAPAPQVNIAETDALARKTALQNAIDSAGLEERFNPGASQLRAGSLEALLAALGPQSSNQLQAYAAGGPPGIGGGAGVRNGNAELLARIQAQAGQPLTNTGFDSQLTRDAVAAAQADLALGGQLPQDVRNLVARQALARSGTVTGGLTLGRDLTARDLGLTSLDLRNRRLQNASQLGGQEAALEQANAAMRLNAEQYGRNNLLQSQGALDAVDGRNAALAAQRDALASSNYFNQGSFLQSIASGDFNRALAAAQLGQNIAQPMSGLDPGSIANLAIGNVNAQAGKQQQVFGAQIGAANAAGAAAGQLTGLGLGMLANYGQQQKKAPATITYDAYKSANPYSTAVLGQY